MKIAAHLGISLLKANFNPIASAAVNVNRGSDPALSNSLPTALAPAEPNMVEERLNRSPTSSLYYHIPFSDFLLLRETKQVLIEICTLHGHGLRHIMIDFPHTLVRQYPTHEMAPSNGGPPTDHWPRQGLAMSQVCIGKICMYLCLRCYSSFSMCETLLSWSVLICWAVEGN